MSWYRTDNAVYVVDSERTPGYYRLTTSGGARYGSVFRSSSPNNGRVDLRGDFVMKADLYFGDTESYGAGIAFHITRDNNRGRLPYWDEMNMQFNGYYYLSVEFDTKGDQSWDIANDHSSLHINGNNCLLYTSPSPRDFG